MTWKCTNTPKGENKLYSDAKGVVPSLDLRFAEGKNLNDYMTGQQLIQFSRSSIGTYVDENGIIQTATADTPRFDHNPTTGESLGLLIEESRTNSYPLSVDFGYGSAVNTVITNNQATAPDNTNTASIFKENAANAAHTFFAVNFAPSGTHTTSIWVKEIQSTPKRYFGLRVYGVGKGITWVNFDLETGTVVGSAGTQLISTFIDPYPNGWYRCGYSSNSDVSDAADGVQLYLSTQPTLESPSYLGNNTSGFYIWGVQVEEGSFPTSYIPTTGTALTRNADVASITGSNFSSWYNESEGTIYGIFDSVREGASRRGWSFGGGGDRHWFYAPISQLIGSSGGSTNYAFTFPAITSTAQKAALGYALNNNAGTINGSTIQSDTSCNPPIGLNSVGIGSDGSGTAGTLLGGTISRLTYFPERLPDSSLQTMTAP